MRPGSMRRGAVAGVALYALTPALLSFAGIDTSDVDAYLMQDMETALKDLEPVLTAGNFDSALADAQVLREGLQYIHGYFLAKGAQDGIRIAVDGQAAIARVLEAIEKKDREAAIVAARDTGKNCKSCHDIYHP